MQRHIEYRTLDNDLWDFDWMKIWTRRELDISTSTFQGLSDVMSVLSRWYRELDIISIVNLDFKRIEEEQIQSIYDEEERRGRHDPINYNLPY